MQLNHETGGGKASRAIGKAVAALLGGQLCLGSAAASEGAPRNRIEFAGLYYKESARVQVSEPTLRWTRSFSGDRSFSLRLGFDAMSGASPSGALPTLQAETYTSPSGKSFRAGAGELPKRTFYDERVSAGLEYTQPWASGLSGNSGVNVSSEADYLSLGISQSLAWEFNRKMTTLTLGASHNRDTVEPRGGLGEPLSDMETGTVEEGGSKSKSISDLLFGVTQILDRRTLLQVNLGLGFDSGFMTEPYKGVSVFDDAGSLVGLLRESRPDSRRRTTLLTRLNRHLGRDVFSGSLRWYHDDWGVDSWTLDLRYHFKPDLDQVWQPHLRYSRQTAADFQRFALREGEPLPEHVSSDMRLADLNSLTLGMKYSRPVLNGRLSLRLEYLLQSAPVPDGQVPEPLRGMDLNPDLKALLFGLGYTIDF